MADLSDEQLDSPSGASDWRVAQVLSHLGSGAEIMLDPLSTSIGGKSPDKIDNEAAWARWDAASPAEQAQLVAADGVFVVIDDGRVAVTGPWRPRPSTERSKAPIRLLAGRLKPEHTPAQTRVSGNISLDDLRRVFAGY